MGNFKSDRRGGFGGRSSGRSGGRDFGGGSRGRGGFGGRDSGRERRPLQMHDVTCDKCGKDCQVPFRPTGDKPVLCSDCFRKNDGNGSRGSGGSSGVSAEQFNKIEAKLNKIIAILQELELDTGEELVEEVANEDEEEDEEEGESEDEEDETEEEEEDLEEEDVK
jgi:CxxC-x17-CxxC domain-containing protein